jgi:WD40 repeat protein
MTFTTLSTPEMELEDVVLAYLSGVDAGRAPDRQDLLNCHPQFASDLAAFFADQDRAATYVAPLRHVGPAGAARPHYDTFGDYEELEEIARGGMGVVYRARQVSLNRSVALKMILGRRLASSMDVQRFQAEAEVCAQLDHPNIVPIYEVGEHQDQHYFSMKLMEGGSLARQIDDGRWTMNTPGRQRQAAQLVATLARAVEHAHQRGLLHRDLKPANILFDLEGRAHVSDFGLFKRVQPVDGEPAQGAGPTVSGMVVGTPSYMAPEQATAPRTVTTAADVYGLGAILYELLASQVPFRASTPLETLHKVTSTEPTRPRSLNPSIDRDLETIAMKCLEKEPRQRYSSAAALAEDLEHWLAGEPIRARPAGAWERAAKWARRRPAGAALCVLLAISFLLGLGALIWGWQAAEAAEREQQARADQELADKRAEAARADQEARDKRRLAVKLYFKNVALARLEFADYNASRANELLQECDADLRGWEWHYLDRHFHPDALTLRQHTAGVVGVAFSPDGDRIASVSSTMQNRRVYVGDFPHGHRDATTTSAHGRAGAIRIVRASDGRELLRVDPKADLIFCLALSPDGKSVACAGATASETGFIRVYDTTSGAELLNLAGPKGPVRSLTYSPDGRRLASAGDDGMASLWDATSGKLLRTIAGRDSSITAICAVAFSPDGRRLAGASLEDSSARIWDVTTGRQVCELHGHSANVTRLAFSPDGKRLATASEDHTVKVWKTDDGRELLTLAGHAAGVTSVAFSPDGGRLASTGHDRAVHVWDSASGLLCFMLSGHAAPVMDVAYSPDGRRLATASLDDTVKVWSTTGGQASLALRPAVSIPLGLAFSPDGRHLAGGCWKESKDVAVLDAATGKVVRVLKGHEMQLAAVAYAPDGKRLASLSLDNTVRVWDPATGQAVYTRRLGGKPSGGVDARRLAYSPDGRLLAAAARTETVKVWEAATGRELHDFRVSATCVAFSPDARRLAWAGPNGLEVRDAVSGKELSLIRGKFELVFFSPDGSRLIGLESEGVKFVETATGKEVMTLPYHTQERIDLAALSPDGRRLALVDVRNVIRLWDTASGEEALALPGHAASVVSLAFSPDGHRLVSADFEGVMRFWDAAPR